MKKMSNLLGIKEWNCGKNILEQIKYDGIF